MTQEELVLWGIGGFVVVLVIATIFIVKRREGKHRDSMYNTPGFTENKPDPPRTEFRSDAVVDVEDLGPSGAPEPEEEEDTVLSTDMKAKEAIDKIRTNEFEELTGFVPDSEDRVTVLRAWQKKKET